jgi:hypothetical protein
MTTTRTRPIARDVELRLADVVCDVDFELTRQLCRFGVPDLAVARCRARDARIYLDELDHVSSDELVYVAAVAIQWAAAIRRRPQPLAPPDPSTRRCSPGCPRNGRPCNLVAWTPEDLTP